MLDTYHYRSMMEAIEEILDEKDEVSPQVQLKTIVTHLKNIVDSLSNEEVENFDELNKKLKKVVDILADEDDNKHQDETIQENDFPSIPGNEYGTAGMGPRIDSNDKQHYEKRNGSSYAERNGFVGP